MKRNFIVLIVGLAVLLAFQAKVIVPFVKDIASSDLFLEDSGDESNRISTSNLMTNEAFNQCNTYIANEVLSDDTVRFPEKPINAFSLGNFRYVINADIDIQPTDSASFTRRYVCRIKYSNDEDSTGTADPENWSVDGISGLDDI